ncbi:MAG: hypothetical protein Q9210_003696 [Variospora velana]
MPKKPSNHPKSALSTGLDWWTSHLQGESRADEWWDYHDTYDDYPQYYQYEEQRTHGLHTAAKPAETDIPGTDAWIEAQAERRRKSTKANASQHLHETSNEAAGSMRVGQSQLEHASEEALDEQVPRMTEQSQRSWDLVFDDDRAAVRLKPPKGATLKEWEMLLAANASRLVKWDLAIRNAVEARLEALYARRGSGMSEQGMRGPLSKSLFIRFSRVEYEALYAVAFGVTINE